MTLTTDQLSQFIDNYAEYIVERLDTKSLEMMVYDLLVKEYSKYTEEEIVGEIVELYGDEVATDLLEQVQSLYSFTLMIISTLTKKGKTPAPYQIGKERAEVQHPEGRFIVWTYHKKVIVDNKVMYQYSPLRYNKEVARFKSKKDAKEFGRYLMGL